MVSSQLCAAVSQHSVQLCNFVIDRDILALYAPIVLLVIHAEEIDITCSKKPIRRGCMGTNFRALYSW